MTQIIDAKTAAEMVKENDRIMFGGFIKGCGAADQVIDAIIEKGTKNLHIIAICTDFADKGVGKLIANKLVKSAQTSHIGTNTASQEQFKSGELKVEFNPQGTLLERIRSNGAGIGGFLTKTGLKTVIEEGKEIITVNGEDYLLETPIGAEFAIINGTKADKNGSLTYSQSAKNSNPVMATSGKIVIAEVEEIVEVGELSAGEIVTPGLFVDYLVLRK